MEWWQIVSVVLGSGVLVAVINLIMKRMERKDAVKDRKDDTAEQLEELRAETSEQFIQVDGRFRSVEKKIDTVAGVMSAIKLSTKTQAYDRIRCMGMQYIKAGEISDEELRNLSEMHEAYKALGGDGFLDKVMAEVYKLRIKP